MVWAELLYPCRGTHAVTVLSYGWLACYRQAVVVNEPLFLQAAMLGVCFCVIVSLISLAVPLGPVLACVPS